MKLKAVVVVVGLDDGCLVNDIVDGVVTSSHSSKQGFQQIRAESYWNRAIVNSKESSPYSRYPYGRIGGNELCMS
jgi:hypothetical protein